MNATSIPTSIPEVSEAQIINTLLTVYNDTVGDIKMARRFLQGMKRTLLGQGHIVQQESGYQAIKSVLDQGRDFSTTTRPWKAARWSKEIAEKNAANVFDGAQRPYRAIHVTKATEECLDRSIETLKALRNSPYFHKVESDINDDVEI
jgi:hypothetical protein